MFILIDYLCWLVTSLVIYALQITIYIDLMQVNIWHARARHIVVLIFKFYGIIFYFLTILVFLVYLITYNQWCSEEYRQVYGVYPPLYCDCHHT